MKYAWRLVGGSVVAIGMSVGTIAWAEEPFTAAPIVDSSDKYNDVGRGNVAHDTYDAIPSASTQASQPRQSYDTAPSVSSNAPRSSAESEQTFLLNKINALHQEVQKLRGQLEVQAHDLKLLSQQQEAYYKDLDQRLAQARTLSSGAKIAENKAVENKIPESKIAEKQLIEAKAPISATPESSNVSTKTETVKPIATTASSENNEQAQYAAAYDLIQQKKYQEAEKSLDAFLTKYPESEYVSNVYYWLGEIYLEQKRTDKAVDVFKTVVNQYPQSPKVSVAMFKLGMAYFEQGRTEEAQVELQKVQQQFPDTSAARLAAAKLKEIGAVSPV